MTYLFLGREIGEPMFDFDADRSVNRTKTLKRITRDAGLRVYRAQFSVEPDAFGDALTAAELDAHLNKHFDGSPFKITWPQHLGTFHNNTIELSAAAAAGARSVIATMSEATPRVSTRVDTLADINIRTRIWTGGASTLDRIGRWQLNGVGMDVEHVEWSAVLTDAVTLRVVVAAAADIGGARAGDAIRLAQGALSATWTINAPPQIHPLGAGKFAADIGLGAVTASAGDGRIDNAAASTVALTRSFTTVTPVDAPLLRGRFVTIGKSVKLHQVVGVSQSGFEFLPGLVQDEEPGAEVNTSPEVHVRYAPEMETAAAYRGSVLFERIVRLEEAW